MIASAVRRLLVGGAIILAASAGEQKALADSVTARREAAVLQARSGQIDDAIGQLRRMLSAEEDDGLVAMDLTALLQQAGRAAEAVAVFEKASVSSPPDYALLAAARAYRDLHRYDEAALLARDGMRRFSDQPVWPLLLSLVLADAGRASDALQILGGPEAGRAPVLDRRLAEGYAWRRAGEPFKALSAYTDALRLAPANAEARTAAAGLLAAQGGAFGAGALANDVALHAPDEAAALVRWGVDARPSDPARRFEITDAAIARLERLLSTAPPETRRRLRLDRLVALRDRSRMREAVEEGAALRAEAPLPPYAEEAYADALLYLRRPEEARAAYHRVLAASPKDVGEEARLSARYGLFYAATELEDFKGAYETIDALVNDQPMWRVYAGAPSRYDNPDRAYAEVTAANARYYGNQIAEAWTRITRISEAAPANWDARRALYEIARARGWPRRAEAEGEIAASLNPDAVDSKLALAEIDIGNARYRDARKRVRELQAAYPEDMHVRQLARDLRADAGWRFEFEASPSHSEGGGANGRGDALELKAKLVGPVFADNWRIFASGDYADAHPPEGFVGRTLASAGVAWRNRDVAVTAFASDNWGTLEGAGAGATLDWSVTDHALVAVSIQHFSWDTPLRALLHGITADEFSTRFTYRWNETRDLSVSVAYLPFTDGNRRYSASLTYEQKLVDRPHFELTGTAALYASSNNRPEAPYFNPEHDLTVEGGLLAEHTIWRRYDNSLVQAVLVNVGVYDQARFAGDVIATLNYEHRWAFDPWFTFDYGVQFGRRVYDGEPENSLAAFLRLARRF